MQKAEVFQRIDADYRRQIGDLDFENLKDRLLVTITDREATVPFFGFDHRVSAQGTRGPHDRRPSHAVSVILFKYLLMCPASEPTGTDWVTYKDFKDAAPFVGGFFSTVEKPIAEAFAGRLPELEDTCRKLNGHPVAMGVISDLVMHFRALPKVPVMLLFNDRDEDFPASATLLFERRAGHFLDMECLAMVGGVLARWLIGNADPPRFRETDRNLFG